MDAIGSQLRKISRNIAGLLVAGVGKAGRIQPRELSADIGTNGGRIHADAGRQPAAAWANQAGALVSICESWNAHVDVQRLATLIGCECGNLPAADNSIQRAIHVWADQITATNGELENDGGDQPVGGVVRAHGPFTSQMVEFLWKAVCQRSEERVSPAEESSMFFDQV